MSYHLGDYNREEMPQDEMARAYLILERVERVYPSFDYFLRSALDLFSIPFLAIRISIQRVTPAPLCLSGTAVDDDRFQLR